jgi:hypothetical protein
MGKEIEEIVTVLTECKIINFDFENFAIKSKVHFAVEGWLRLYTAEIIKREIMNADNWLIENGKLKKNYLRYIGNWLRRSGQYGGTRTERGRLTQSGVMVDDGMVKYKVIS